MLAKAKYWWFRFRSWWNWYRGASTRYDVHSPGMSRFIESVWQARKDQELELAVLHFRRSYRRNNRWVPTPQLGAASKIRPRKQRRLSELVQHSAIAPAEGQLLASIARYSQAATILELGTNAGISGAYLALSRPEAILYTVEGNPDLAKLARQGFDQLGLTDRVRVYQGLFGEQLPSLLPQLSTIDLLFIDGDHRYQSSLDYVRACLPLASPSSIIILADIHWSAEMVQAWDEIRQWPQVSTSIDTYHFGILFFDPTLRTAPPISLIKTRYKPWRVGFF